MLRRHVIAKGTMMLAAAPMLAGAPVLGALMASSAGPRELILPSQVGPADVAEIQDSTEQLRVAARTRGGQARAVSAIAVQYGNLAEVPATSEAVKKSLFSQLAELNELAGWCSFDSGSDLHGRWHYRKAVDLAYEVSDHYRMASAMLLMGIIDSVRKRPDDALKQFELAQLVLGSHGDPELLAWLHALSARNLAAIGHPNAIDRLARSRDGWEPLTTFAEADMNYQTALVHVELGNMELAERFASAVNGAGEHRPVGVFATVLRATMHVQAGEPGGLLLAKTALDAVAPLYSTLARQRLRPLITALESRPGSDYRDLARTARTIVSARHISA